MLNQSYLNGYDAAAIRERAVSVIENGKRRNRISGSLQEAI